ncbi:MAG TPA: formate dehydrogenase subunit delta [Gallionella sp.]|nr:formate dehydrogenase subunit delta [Gallionella sp.]
MNPAKLIKMANQIGAFFEAMPDRQQAIQGIAAHIERNWEPRMRAGLLQHIGKSGDSELSPLVRDALALVQRTG